MGGAGHPDTHGNAPGLSRHVVVDLEPLDGYVALGVDREQPVEVRWGRESRPVYDRVLTGRVAEHHRAVRGVARDLGVHALVVDAASDVDDGTRWNARGGVLDGSPGVGLRSGRRVLPVDSYPERSA